ncbi:NAD(P)H-dependent oxidoreductase [Chryseobacterium shandongense]|uniref:NAD(P)H-dependent oxidoreductase n=1 Tax=Chryseobacterium shandongense TaxID=1493872 RepID=UPI001E5812AD|nr:NAD(P)H-dependent oxidoreductase [Chryseobacterium shandongense]
MNILVILSHPNLENSIANKTIIEQLSKRFEQIEIRHLETLYPDYKIDVEGEQAALLTADFLIFQHPFYWYSTPPMLKKYLDDVMTPGFAIGVGGDKLKGKQFLQSITLAGSQQSYTALGYNHFRVQEFLKPMEQTAFHTQMIYNLPIYSHRNEYKPEVFSSVSEVKENAVTHAEKVIEKIEDFLNGNKSNVAAFIYKWFEHFDMLDDQGYFIQYLDTDIEFTFPGYGTITGHESFKQWYTSVKEKFEKPLKHEVQNLVIEESFRNQFDIRFQVKFSAIQKESQKEFTVFESENWKLFWNETTDRPVIKKYTVSN